MVARVVVGIPTVLCLWISEIIASLPGRCAVTVLELLTGTMLTGYGSISQAILAVPCRRHWTSYYWMVRKGQFDWKAMVHALCRIVRREFPSERCVVVGDDTLIPRVSAAAPGAAIQYDHARKPNRPDYLLTVVSLSAVIGKVGMHFTHVVPRGSGRLILDRRAQRWNGRSPARRPRPVGRGGRTGARDSWSGAG